MKTQWAASDKRKRAATLAKLAETKCKTKWCRNQSSKSGKSPYCSRCRTRRFKSAHPLMYYFRKLRDRAKERGRDFQLTYSEYVSFAIKTNYALLKGKTTLSLSIDRRDNSKGYTFENLQAITLRENSRKQFVKFYANQQPSESYEPSAEEIAEIENKMRQMQTCD